MAKNPTVFISRKSEDATIGRELYYYLTNQKIQVFDSDISLPQIGDTKYRNVIDGQLEKANHMVLIATKLHYITSGWVASEWDTFENEWRSERKKGNLILLISKKITISELPISLRQKQVFFIEDKPFELMLPYLSDVNISETIQPQTSNKSNKSMLKYPAIALFISIAIYLGFNKQTKVEPKSTKSQNTDSLFITTQKQFLENGLDKTITLNNFKKVALINPSLGYKAAEVFQKKAISTPILKDKYLMLSEEMITFTDSITHEK